MNCGSLSVACDEASPHSCRASSELAHDQAASISLDRVDGIESFVSFERDLVNGRVLGSVNEKKRKRYSLDFSASFNIFY